MEKGSNMGVTAWCGPGWLRKPGTVLSLGRHCPGQFLLSQSEEESYREKSQSSGVDSAQVSGQSLYHEYIKQAVNSSAEERGEKKEGERENGTKI